MSDPCWRYVASFIFNFETTPFPPSLMCAHVCVKAHSFRNEEGILLYVLVFCIRYDSLCPLTLHCTLANTCCAVNRSVLKLNDGKQMFSYAERLAEVCV